MTRRQLARLVIEHLRGEQRGLELEDRLALRGGKRLRCLGMPGRRTVRLVGEIEVDRGEALGRAENAIARSRIGERFSSIPHYGAQEFEIGRRQRATEQRQFARAGVAVWVVDREQGEFGALRDADADANQSFVEQHAISDAPSLDSGHIGVWGRRTIVGAEDGIRSIRGIEPCPDVCGVTVQPTLGW